MKSLSQDENQEYYPEDLTTEDNHEYKNETRQ